VQQHGHQPGQEFEHMAQTSITEAKNRLTRLIYQAERGEAAHTTRRGRSVAVLLWEAEKGRLSRGTVRPNFSDAIREMPADPGLGPVDLEPEAIESWRDRAAKDRGLEWPE
jgi:antitoxin (DNA-binding transcriptional repressor) of toxin-antitoxin stability system